MGRDLSQYDNAELNDLAVTVMELAGGHMRLSVRYEIAAMIADQRRLNEAMPRLRGTAERAPVVKDEQAYVATSNDVRALREADVRTLREARTGSATPEPEERIPPLRGEIRHGRWISEETWQAREAERDSLREALELVLEHGEWWLLSSELKIARDALSGAPLTTESEAEEA